MSKLARFMDWLLDHIRVLPALPASAWWVLWCACMGATFIDVLVRMFTGAFTGVLSMLGGFGFCLLALTPTLRIGYRVRIPELYGEMWMPLDERFLQRAIIDTRVTHLERVETRDGRIKRVEPLPLPNRQ